MTVFAEGIEGTYNGHTGRIRFTCDQYVTLCISEFPDQKVRDVCILIYRHEFDQIKLIKESEK
jgi:hypothetical protein